MDEPAKPEQTESLKTPAKNTPDAHATWTQQIAGRILHNSGNWLLWLIAIWLLTQGLVWILQDK